MAFNGVDINRFLSTAFDHQRRAWHAKPLLSQLPKQLVTNLWLGQIKNDVKNTPIGFWRTVDGVGRVPGFRLVLEQKAAVVHHLHCLNFAKVRNLRI